MPRDVLTLWCCGVMLAVTAATPVTSFGAVNDALNATELGERFISGFYSWQSGNLSGLMAEDTDTSAVLYYQGWAEAAHYVVVKRRPCQLQDNEVVCAITVSDDFGTALGYTATDTFRLTVAEQRIQSVSFAGDDPPVFNELFEWIQQQRPEVLIGPCHKMFAGGQTPGDCARAVAQAARDFIQQHRAAKM